MKAMSVGIAPEIPSMEHLPSFNVVVVYEDFASGNRAKRTCQSLAQNCGKDCQLHQSMWKFDTLNIARLKELAAEEAAEADMIIISARNDGPLSEEVKSWIETWLHETATNDRALVSLSLEASAHAPRAASMHSYLEGVARRSHMDFFAQSADADEPGDFSSWEIKSEDEPPARLAWSAPLSRQWGINE